MCVCVFILVNGEIEINTNSPNLILFCLGWFKLGIKNLKKKKTLVCDFLLKKVYLITHTHTHKESHETKKRKKIRGSTCDDRWWGNKKTRREKNKWDNDNKPDQSLSFSYFQAVDLITLDTGTYSVRLSFSLSISSIFQWNNDVENQRERCTHNYNITGISTTVKHIAHKSRQVM